MTIKTINAQTALELLDAAVELAGADHMYERVAGHTGCQYAHGENPGCIVAVALAVHGVPIETLQAWDELDAEQGIGIASVYRKDHAPFLTARAAEVFATAQRVQDRGAWADGAMPDVYGWGVARDDARRFAAGHAEIFPDVIA